MARLHAEPRLRRVLVRQVPVRQVPVRHEQAAVPADDGYARSSGRVATASIGTDAFQACDALAISKPVTKWNVQVRSADEVAAVLGKVLDQTIGWRPGPVLVDFSKGASSWQAVPA